MSTKDFTANVISATKVVPDGNFKDSKASGVWDINEALDLIKGGNWPNVANFNPDAFVDALFQCHLWDGSGSSRSITNNINLSGSGGLVWYKGRDTGGQGATQRHSLYDTERGVTKRLISNENHAESTEGTGLTAFNTTGFTIGGDAETNQSNYDYVSWTFREQPKFFDIVKYEGTGSDRTVAHSLGTTVGMIIIKNLDQTDNWAVYHREAYDQNAGADYVLHLNTNSARTNSSDYFNDTAPTSSVFTVGTDHTVNASGENYIAYLFAHNDGDGGFGEPGDQDIIKCGSYTGNGSSTGPVVTLGFEPQFIMLKKINASQNANWYVFDTMRGIVTGGDDPYLYANTNAAEVAGNVLEVTPTGFQLKTSSNGFNGSSDTYIYMAIRRGGMQTPTAASDVFALDDSSTTDNGGYTLNSNFPVDFYFFKNKDGGDSISVTRLTVGDLRFNLTAAEEDRSSIMKFDSNTGVTRTSFQGNIDSVDYAFRRALSFFDVVAYTGDFTTSNSIAHNLGVAPEMMWIRRRDAVAAWQVPALITSSGYRNMRLDTTYEGQAISSYTDYTGLKSQPTSTNFVLGQNSQTNVNGGAFIAYLFATVANVSKVGSFTQSGATNVACGFTGSTPAFIILKRTDAAGDWYLFDSERGIVAGNDPYLELNTSDAEVTNTDLVDPYSGGFATTSSLTNGDYIFYAIASIA